MKFENEQKIGISVVKIVSNKTLNIKERNNQGRKAVTTLDDIL